MNLQALALHPWPDTYETAVAPPSIVAEALTAELIEAGGLGHFVISLMHTWNDLTETERLQAAWCWQCATAQVNVAAAA